jgi:hypothetical protein
MVEMIHGFNKWLYLGVVCVYIYFCDKLLCKLAAPKNESIDLWFPGKGDRGDTLVN